MHKMSFEIRTPEPARQSPWLALFSLAVLAVFGLVFFDAWIH